MNQPQSIAQPTAPTSAAQPPQPAPAPQAITKQPPTLRTQIARSVGGVAALLTIAVCLSFGEWMRYRSQQQAGQALQNVADHSVVLLHRVLRSQSLRVQELARVRGLWVEGFHSPRVRDALQWMHHLAPQSVWVDVSSPEGIIETATMHGLVGTNVGNTQWFNEALKGPYISDVTVPSLTSGATISGSLNATPVFVPKIAPVIAPVIAPKVGINVGTNTGTGLGTATNAAPTPNLAPKAPLTPPSLSPSLAAQDGSDHVDMAADAAQAPSSATPALTHDGLALDLPPLEQSVFGTAASAPVPLPAEDPDLEASKLLGANHMLLDFSAPIIGVHGEVMGVLSQHTRWGWVHEVVERMLSGQRAAQMQTFIFDAAGQLIYAPGARMAEWESLGQRMPDQLKRSMHRDPDEHYAPIIWRDSDEPYLSAAARLPVLDTAHDLGWWVVTRQPIEAAYAGANRVAYLALLIGLVAGAITAAVAYVLARHLSQDLKLLAQSAQSINASIEQNTAQPIPQLHSSVEVKQLSQTLAAMTSTLLSANGEMRRIIAERTQALSQANAELQRQAHTDPLTKLLNRRGFEARADFLLALARRNKLPMSVITFDIDHFKRINDRFGHDVGDKVLVALADILRNRTRASDVIARFGGEEFVALLPDTSAEMALKLANQLLVHVRSAHIDPVGAITVSAGVAGWDTNLGLDGLAYALKASDEALYEAKESGRDRAVIHA